VEERLFKEVEKKNYSKSWRKKKVRLEGQKDR
jgi:hypothetical protein